ncbi:MAG TPA: hypothetical protein VFM34_09950 [Moraxellaceae bacterium]|nr:hypothetical protein [Moraxellaceae bacterium]
MLNLRADRQKKPSGWGRREAVLLVLALSAAAVAMADSAPVAPVDASVAPSDAASAINVRPDEQGKFAAEPTSAPDGKAGELAGLPPGPLTIPPDQSGEAPAISPLDTETEHLLFPDEFPPDDKDGQTPPRLLSPKTRPDPAPPLVRVPVLTTQAPIPLADAGNCVQRDDRGRFMGWMDRQQCVFSGRAIMTARWIDDFFGDWYSDEASMMARLATRTLFTQGQGLTTRVGLHASFSLPNARERLRLVVSDDEDEDPTGQQGRRIPASLQDTGRMSAALRWISVKEKTLESNFDIGARGIAPIDVFARYRLRKTWSISSDAVARLTETLRYGSDSRERYTTELNLERALDDRAVLRFSSLYDYSHDFRDQGFLWNHGVSVSRALPDARSYSYGVTLSGHTDPNWRGESVGPWVAWRSRFLRPWLFYEVEPHYTYYRNLDWGGLFSVLLTVEMQFGWK